MLSKKAALAAGIFVCAASYSAAQVPLLPGGTVAPLPLDGLPNGVQFVDQLFSATRNNVDGFFVGVTTTVFKDASNHLIFDYQIENDTQARAVAANETVVSFSVNSFQGWITNVGMHLDPFSTVGAFSTARSLDGSTLTMTTAVPMAAGGLSDHFDVFTDASSYQQTGTGLFMGSIPPGDQLRVAVFTPNAVPEPAGLVAMGIGGITFMRRRRS
jgi:hypothetical protein